jgi:hypothetical protein
MSEDKEDLKIVTPNSGQEQQEQPKSGKGVSVGITEHPLYGLGVKLVATDINHNKADLFLTIDEAINFAGRFNSVANLAFVLGQIAGMMQGSSSAIAP